MQFFGSYLGISRFVGVDLGRGLIAIAICGTSGLRNLIADSRAFRVPTDLCAVHPPSTIAVYSIIVANRSQRCFANIVF